MPSFRTAGSNLGEEGSFTLFGPPVKMIPLYPSFAISSDPMLPDLRISA